ncbi:hypothetical protein GW17_00043524 [Ensete ventricosum]|nr:hypothetical protein GW17_00043524 [Ensete ventricosum]
MRRGGQPPYRAGHTWPGRLQGAAGCDQGQSPLQGQPPAGTVVAGMVGSSRPQGAAARGQAAGGGCPLQGRKGQPRDQVAGGGCPLQGLKGQPRDEGCRLQGRPLAGAAANRASARARRRRPPAREVPPESVQVPNTQVSTLRRLEEFRCRDLSYGYRERGLLTSFIFSIRIWNTGIYDLLR